MVLIRSPYFRKMISDLRLHLDHTKRVMNLGLGTYNEQKSSWNEQRIDLELLSYVHKERFSQKMQQDIQWRWRL
jgi:hypothetical protein